MGVFVSLPLVVVTSSPDLMVGIVYIKLGLNGP